MRKILISALFLTLSALSVAQDSGEEAIILNQEMEFLRLDAQEPQVFLPQTAVNETKSRGADSKEEMDLEKFFFGEDRIETKAAAPRRRAAED